MPGPRHVVALLVSFVVLAGCMGEAPGDPTPTTPTTTTPSTPSPAVDDSENVDIEGFAFVPATVEIPVGGKVTWRNRDATVHTATSDGGPEPFHSGVLQPDDDYRFTFSTEGRYTYFCEVHESMRGTVVVGNPPPE